MRLILICCMIMLLHTQNDARNPFEYSSEKSNAKKKSKDIPISKNAIQDPLSSGVTQQGQAYTISFEIY